MTEAFSFISENKLKISKHMQGYLLSKNLYDLFVNYIRSNRLRAPEAKQLTELIKTFQDGAKHDRRALQSKFKSWSRRMDVREKDGKLIIQQSGKEILPVDKCLSLVMELHCETEEHRDIDIIVNKIQKTYSWGRRDFGMDWDIVASILSQCNKTECLQKLQTRFQPKSLSPPPIKRIRISDVFQKQNEFIKIQTKFRPIMPAILSSNANYDMRDIKVEASDTEVESIQNTSELKKLLTNVDSKIAASQSIIKSSALNNLSKTKVCNIKPNASNQKSDQKISFKVEINSSGQNLKSTTDFKKHLKNFITSYFKYQADLVESTVQSENVSDAEQMPIQNYPVWQNTLLSSNSLQISKHSNMTVLITKDQNISSIAINSLPQICLPISSRNTVNSTVQSVSCDKTSSILTYTLPNRPLSFMPQVGCLMPQNTVQSSSTEIMNSDNQNSTPENQSISDKSFLKPSIKIQTKIISVPTDIDEKTLDNDYLKEKPVKLKYILEKPEKNLEKDINDLSIKIHEKRVNKNNKSKLISHLKNKSGIKQYIKTEDKISDEKNIEDMYDTLVDSIHSMKNNVLPVLIGTGRGKYVELLKNGIDDCTNKVKELKKML